MGKTVILVIASGFYYFGTRVDSGDPTMISIVNASMFGGFSGGKGMPGVARGDKDAKVTLDRFSPNEILEFPISACLGIVPSVDLYSFHGTTLR
jgi:hypothetical protein